MSTDKNAIDFGTHALTTLREEVARNNRAFEAFRQDRLERDQRLNNRWYQAFLAFGFSFVTVAASVIWFASNADGRISRNAEAIQALRMGEGRMLDMAARIARTEAIVKSTDARTTRIERALDARTFER